MDNDAGWPDLKHCHRGGRLSINTYFSGPAYSQIKTEMRWCPWINVCDRQVCWLTRPDAISERRMIMTKMYGLILEKAVKLNLWHGKTGELRENCPRLRFVHHEFHMEKQRRELWTLNLVHECSNHPATRRAIFQNNINKIWCWIIPKGLNMFIIWK